ncbi:MAG: LacI family DNA-binding transcriptional regulator [Pseudomonadota bacterium]
MASTDQKSVDYTAPRPARRRPQRPKIHDVAELAGVSTKTVSRVLNNEKYVRPETREKVVRAVAELDYTPDFSARSLAGQRSFMLALFYGSVSEAYLAKFQAGVIAQCAEHRHHLLVERVEDDAENIGHLVAETAAQTRVDGVILVPPLSDNPAIVAALEERQTPYVLVAPTKKTAATLSVDTDNFAAARQLVSHLVSLGHKKIAIIKGHPSHSATPLRYEGYRAALTEAGLNLDADLEKQGYFTTVCGREMGKELLELANRPTAIFASNDDMAAGAARAAADLGLRVPEDVSIVGFDDSLIASISAPPLTTVRQPIDQMARGAVELLLEQRTADEETASTRHKDYEFELVFRESAGPATDAG